LAGKWTALSTTNKRADADVYDGDGIIFGRERDVDSGARDGGSKSGPGAKVVKNPWFTTLVVDGDLPFSGVLNEFIETEGHFVLRAKDAEEALAKTRQFQPHFILLNAKVEGLAALELLPKLLLEDAGAAVILMAGSPGISDAVEAMRLGAADYLELPLNPERLRQSIENQKALIKAS
jgi:ActR/RegA family two-component response regulator